MFAALAVAPTAALDTGLTAAMIFAAGVTALVALAMLFIGLRRGAQLTLVRGMAASLLGLGVIAIAIVGIVAVSPGPAQATPDGAAPALVPADDGLDLQLPTLSLD